MRIVNNCKYKRLNPSPCRVVLMLLSEMAPILPENMDRILMSLWVYALIENRVTSENSIPVPTPSTLKVGYWERNPEKERLFCFFFGSLPTHKLFPNFLDYVMALGKLWLRFSYDKGLEKSQLGMNVSSALHHIHIVTYASPSILRDFRTFLGRQQ